MIFATLVVLPLGALALGARGQVELLLWDRPLHLTLAVMVVAGGIGATLARNRLSAVLMVGVTGYGCAAAFAFHGAPDLALTQLLVETVTLVIFVLVLRTLRRNPPNRPCSIGCRARCCRWRSASVSRF